MATPVRSELEALSRGLAVLTAINAHGPASLGELSKRLDLPRTTLRRILTTLIAEGCCLRLPSSALYALAPGVRRLSGGYSVADHLTAASSDILPALSRRLGWPAAFAAPEGLSMRVRLSTDFASPQALARMRPGYVTPQVETTTGILYLASLNTDRVGAQLDAIYAEDRRTPLRFARDEVETLIGAARADGYLVIERAFPEASLGVPLTVDGRVEGGLVVRYMRSAVRRQEACARLLPPLLDAAALICARAADQGACRGAVTGS